MSKIHTCLRQVISVQQKYEFSTSVCSDNAKCFCKNLKNERTHFCAWDFTLNQEEFVFHLVLGSDSFLVWTWKSSFCRDTKPHIYFKGIFQKQWDAYMSRE